MSNRRKIKPTPSAAARAYAKAYRCHDCTGHVVRLRHDKHQAGVWHVDVAHDDDCPVLTGRVSPHTAGLAASASVATTGARVAYLEVGGPR